MRILIVGAGGIGGYFGALLCRAGRDVTFLVREGRRATLEKNGLNVEGATTDIHLSKPATILANEISDEFDLVILSCKAYDLVACIADFSAAVGHNTLVLPLLNGLKHLELLDAHFGDQRVLGGLCFVSTTLKDDGKIVQLNDSQKVTLGERGSVSRNQTLAVAAALSGSGFEVVHSSDILRDMWEKWVFIATGAALTSLMRAPIGDIVSGGGRELAEGMLTEAALIADAAGYPIGKAGLSRLKAMFTTPGSLLSASLFRDIENGARIEADHILGDLLTRSGEESPVLEIALAHMKTYEARREREAKRSA